ncbi:MAG: hypothetical protein SNJ79_10070, partial [Sphingomonadaceae bacterium]
MNDSDTTISETDSGQGQIVTVHRGARDITIDCARVRERIRAGESVPDIAAELGIRTKQLRRVLQETGGKPTERPSASTAALQDQARARAEAAMQVP